jgi:Flp pilus assembly protein TadD
LRAGGLVKFGVFARAAFTAVALPALVAACAPRLAQQGPQATILPPAASPDSSGDPARLGAGYFNRGEYGQAERCFREAVEKSPRDASAWIGLAASYDRLRRFDLADGAYEEAIKLSGETAQILNNQGYSYLLRGNLATARVKLASARSLEPGNPAVLNNLKILDGSAKYMKTSAQ